MSRHGYSHGSGGGDLPADAVGMAIVLLVICIYLLFRGTCFVIQTGIKYPVKGFFISLAIFVGCGVLGGLLSILLHQDFSALAGIGALQLLMTCAVIRRKYSGTFLREDVSLQEEILHRKWWADDDTPLAA